MILNKPYLLTEIKKLTPSVTSFVFKAQDSTSIDFTPGMFAMLQYKGQDGQSIARAFSIANSPPSSELEFIIALIHGAITSKLEAAKVGDIYYVSAPYGQFKFDINSSGKFLFLAGGTGLAPFMSMLRYAKSLGKEIDTNIIYSTKYSNEIIYKDELAEYARTSEFKMTITVTRPQPGDGWTGITGHVNADMISKSAPDFKERISYICGPPAFVKAVKEALISLGVDEKSIKAEMWGE
jgi:ferredoxin-NADP reductase